MLRAWLFGHKSSKPINDYNGRYGVGLINYTYPREEYEVINKPFLNDTYGLAMNQNGSGIVTITENIHDGTDNTYWTASTISGSWSFDSTDENHTPAGSMSIDGTSANNNHRCRIDKGSDLDLTPYLNLTGWIFIDDWSTGGSLKDIELDFKDSGAVTVGNLVFLSGYINTTLFNEWQQFTIPLSDMGAVNQTIRSLDVNNRDQGGGRAPNFYLDDIAITGQAAGSSDLEYVISPTIGTRFHLTRVKFVMRDVYSETSSGQHAFSLDGFFNEPELTNGILANIKRRGQITGSAVVKNFSEWMGFPQFENINSGSDGTNTWITFDITFKGLVLESKYEDTFSYIIRDDLSGLIQMQAVAEGYIVTDEEA